MLVMRTKHYDLRDSITVTTDVLKSRLNTIDDEIDRINRRLTDCDTLDTELNLRLTDIKKEIQDIKYITVFDKDRVRFGLSDPLIRPPIDRVIKLIIHKLGLRLTYIEKTDDYYSLIDMEDKNGN